MGFRRASISQQTLESPFELFDLIYGSTRSGMFSIQYGSYCMSKLNDSLYDEIFKELIMHTNRRIETHNSNIGSNRRKISPISDKASFPSSDWLI